MSKVSRPYGTWSSPLSPRSLAAGRRIVEIQWDDYGDTLVWVEARGAHNVLVAMKVSGSDAPRDLTDEVNVRARVGYGGGDFTVGRGTVYFANGSDGRLWRLSLNGGAARPITPAFGSVASPRLSPCGRYVCYVHHDDNRVDRLAIVDVDGANWPQCWAQGHDFYTQPRLSTDGKYLAYVAWNHPHMPWDESTLWLSEIRERDEGLPVLNPPIPVAGGADTAVFQPEFGQGHTTLFYIGDSTGFGELWAYDLETRRSRQVTRGDGVEHGMPNWIQEMRTYALAPNGRHAWMALNCRGFSKLGRVDLNSGQSSPWGPLSAYGDVAQLTVGRSTGHLALIASGPTLPQRLLVLEESHDEDSPPRVIARTATESIDVEDLSTPTAVTWRTAELEEAHGLLWPPTNRRFTATGKPPLLVIVHGGPSSQMRAAWSAQIQFFTSRGFMVLGVNHRGSTGYGRAFMKKLRGAWGKVDVEDCVYGARWAAESGRADGDRMVIMGGSAGGYTVLQTMVDQPEVFAAGIAIYGVANQFTLAQGTHKFEEHYNDTLLGALPEAAALWRARSPVFGAAKIRRPLAVFQGAEDKVVPPDQAKAIVDALRQTGTPHLYHLYEGEGHGFRKPETLEHFYKTVESFLAEHVLWRSPG